MKDTVIAREQVGSYLEEGNVEGYELVMRVKLESLNGEI